jgi:ribosomal protein S27E
VQATGTQLASLAQTLAEEEFAPEMATGLLQRAGGSGAALDAAAEALAERVRRDPKDQTAKTALELVRTAITHSLRTSRHPSYVRCGNCAHKGAYLVADRPIVRCKYCSSALALSLDERAKAEGDLAAFAARLR